MIEFIDRQLATTLRDAARYFSVICLTGPRQSGKSTLTCRLFEEYHCVSLENPDIRMSAAADPMAFLNQTNGGLIIDEIQRLPMLLEYISMEKSTSLFKLVVNLCFPGFKMVHIAYSVQEAAFIVVTLS